MENLFDVVIIGSGPAGLTAAIYLARARYRVIVLEKESFGGQITITNDVINYPGIEHTTGRELSTEMRKQAQSFGAEFSLAEVTKLEMNSDIKIVRTTQGDLKCFGILLATGAHPRTVGFEGEIEFRGRGVAYCATCDGEFFTGKEIFVIGNSFAAAEQSIFLTKYASDINILLDGDDFTCSKIIADEVRSHRKITIIENTEIIKVAGDTSVKKIVYKNIKTGEITEYEDPAGLGVFVFAGYEPATDLIRGIAELDKGGYVVTDKNQQTTCAGLYAAGDVCIKDLRQVVTAVSDGALAATELEKYAANLQNKTGLKPVANVTRINDSSDATEKLETVGEIFDSDIISQLETVFDRMENNLTLKLYLDDRAVSEELKIYAEEMAKLTNKLTIEFADDIPADEKPCIKIFKNNIYTGLAFHGCPGGHEFTAFVLGLYNAAGSGQKISDEILTKIKSVDKNIDMKILVTLGCEICHALVIAAQKIAAENNLITAEVFDINHFAELKNKFNVMSVPCLVAGDKITFGKKNISQVLNFII